MAKEKITLSVIKADVGGFVGHSDVHLDLLFWSIFPEWVKKRESI